MANLQGICIYKAEFDYIVVIDDSVFEMDGNTQSNGVDMYLGKRDEFDLSQHKKEHYAPSGVYKQIIARLRNEMNYIRDEARDLLKRSEEAEHTDVGEVNDFLTMLAKF